MSGICMNFTIIKVKVRDFKISKAFILLFFVIAINWVLVETRGTAGQEKQRLFSH